MRRRRRCVWKSVVSAEGGDGSDDVSRRLCWQRGMRVIWCDYGAGVETGRKIGLLRALSHKPIGIFSLVSSFVPYRLLRNPFPNRKRKFSPPTDGLLQTEPPRINSRPNADNYNL